MMKCLNCARDTGTRYSIISLEVRNCTGGYYAFPPIIACESCKGLVIEKYKEEIQDEYGGE